MAPARNKLDSGVAALASGQAWDVSQSGESPAKAFGLAGNALYLADILAGIIRRTGPQRSAGLARQIENPNFQRRDGCAGSQ